MSLRKVLTVASVGGRLLARDRTALFFVVVLPFLIILVVGSVTGSDDPVRLGLVRDGRGSLADELVDRLRSAEVIEVIEVSSPASASRAVRRGRLAGALVIPADYDDALSAGKSLQLELLAPLDRPSSVVLRATVSGLLHDQAAKLAAAHTLSGTPFAERLDAAERAAALMAGPELQDRSAGTADAASTNPFSHTAPANLVLFVFVTSLASGAAMIESRRLGILRRMLATPTSVSTVLVGSALSRLLVAIGQAALILVLGAVAFGVSWGDPLAAAMLVLVFAVVSVGAGLVISTVFRSTEQATAIAAPMGIALGMLGGCMWPLDIVGPLMRTVGHVTPHAWAMDGWHRLVEDGAGVGGIARELAVLSALAVALFGVGVMRLRRELISGS